jgi:hypothetical protein
MGTLAPDVEDWRTALPPGPSPHAHNNEPISHADALAVLVRRYGVPVGWSPSVAWVLKPQAGPPAPGDGGSTAGGASGSASRGADSTATLELIRTDLRGPPHPDGLALRLTFSPGAAATPGATPVLLVPIPSRPDFDKALKAVGDALSGWRPLRP